VESKAQMPKTINKQSCFIFVFNKNGKSRTLLQSLAKKSGCIKSTLTTKFTKQAQSTQKTEN